MKHHHPQLCERVSALHRSGCSVKKSLQKEFSSPSTVFKKRDSLPEPAEQSLVSLSDLLLALQDELGQMSLWVSFFHCNVHFCFWHLATCGLFFFFFISEQQDLVRQIDATQDREQKQDLQRELQRLVTRMEEKGVQISKLRQHQQTVCVLPLWTTLMQWL